MSGASVNSVYLSGWEYNRFLSDDATTPRNSALPASILWHGAHQLWMFEHVYVTKEAYENECYATDALGWVMGDVLRFLQDEEHALTRLDWSEFDYDLREHLQVVHERVAPYARAILRGAIAHGYQGELELLKNLLLDPVLRRFGCVASGTPTSLGTWLPGTERAPEVVRHRVESDLLRSIVQPLIPGVEACGNPARMATGRARDRQRQVQEEIEAPMIVDLIAKATTLVREASSRTSTL